MQDNTQKPRKTLLLILTLTMPLTFICFSPVLIQMATQAKTFALVHVMFLLFFVSLFFLGRVWCSYACPFGAFQDVLAAVFPLRQTNNKVFKIVRHVLGIVWLAALLYPIVFIGFTKTDLFFFPSEPGAGPDERLMTYMMIAGMFATLTYVIGKRALCKYACPSAMLIWIGMQIKKVLPMPTFKLSAVKQSCSGCGTCRKVCPMDLDAQALVDGKSFSEGACILCGVCVAHCPDKAIKRGFGLSKHANVQV